MRYITQFWNAYLGRNKNTTVEKQKDDEVVDERLERLVFNYPVGTKIIVVGNEPYSQEDPDKLVLATVTGHMCVTQAQQPIITWEEDGSEEAYMMFSEPLYYSPELAAALSKLTWAERWNIVSGGMNVIDDETKQRKEGYAL